MRFVYHYMTALLLLISYPFTAIGQIGIGTITPNPSAIMDMTSQNQGMLTPRMTTVQRKAIANPANGLLVFYTDLNSFEYYNGPNTRWERMSSINRDNFVLVKSQADFPAVAGGTITLDENTIYEINGTVTLTASINLNGAYIAGLDASEDVLSFPGGTIFKGIGGSIRNVTLTGGKAFEIDGGSMSTGGSFLLQNTAITGMTTSVGSVTRVALIFTNVVQFIGNANGITYSNIGNLLLNNQAWLGNNSGTYEKLTGSFGLVEKVSGFSTINGSSIGFDISTPGLSVPVGVLLGTVFSGNGSYVKRYTTGSYPGYNFTNNWTVSCPGIPAEDDAAATGNLYYTSSSVTTIGNNPVKLPVSTTSVRNFRTSSTVSNRLVYEGSKERSLNIFGSISFTAVAGMRLIFSIYKNGNPVPGTEVVYNIPQTNDRQGLAVVGTVNSSPGDFIEIYVKRDSADSAGTQFLVTSYNLLVN